jgi:alpha-soluble NSF attachment protein
LLRFPFPSVAIQALSQTIVHLTQAGRFRQAADREKEIAQIYLQEQNDLRHACESFERAGDWYAQEDAAAYVAFFNAALLRNFTNTYTSQYC